MDPCQMVTAMPQIDIGRVTDMVTKTLTEYTGPMNLMPFLAFQISFSETLKMCSENSLEVETHSRIFLTPSDFLGVVDKDLPDLECITSLRIIIQLINTKSAQIRHLQILSDH